MLELDQCLRKDSTEEDFPSYKIITIIIIIIIEIIILRITIIIVIAILLRRVRSIEPGTE